MITEDFFIHKNVEFAKKQHWWLYLRYPNESHDLYFKNLLHLGFYKEALFELNKIINKRHIDKNFLIKSLIRLRENLGVNVVNSQHIFYLSIESNYKPLTKIGENNKQEIFKILDVIVNQNFPNGFLEEFCYEDESGKLKSNTRYLFHFEYYELKGHLIKKIGIACSNLIREAENQLRVSIGGKKISEGFISETELFHNLKKYFPQYKVIQHGRPKFLGRQHFDIWFPELNIAIEYQGAQHYQPIVFFGGKEAFEKNQYRDNIKREKCIENKVNLIEVRPDYKFDDLVNVIKGFIK